MTKAHRLNFILLGYLLLITAISGQNNPAVDDLIQKAISAQKMMDPEPRKYNQAKSLESAGLLDEAEKVYRDLNEQFPGVSKYFRPLRNLLKQKDDFEALEEYSTRYVTANPTDDQGWVDLGEVYMWWDKPDEWKSIFDDLIQNRSGDGNIVKMIIGRLVANGMNEEGVIYLQKYRDQIGDPHFYSLEMGIYFSMQMSWENSLDEYLNFLSGTDVHSSIVSERILSMPEDESIQSTILSKLETAPIPEAKFILADVYFKNRNYQKAYEVLKTNNAGDERILEFGNDLLLIKQYNLVDSVMNDILLTSKDEKTLESAIFNIAQAYEERTLQSLFLLPISGLFRENLFFTSPFLRVDESQSMALYKAMAIYDSLKTATNSLEAGFKLGEIRFRAMNDLDGADIQYNELISMPGIHAYKLSSFMRMIDIRLAKGDITRAESKIVDALSNPVFLRTLGQNAESDLRMKLIQVYFYSGKQQEMDSLTTWMTKTLPNSDDRLNDVLELSGLATGMKPEGDMLSRFAEIQLKIHQNKRTEAIRLLETMLESENASNIGLMRYQYAQLLLLQGDVTESLSQLELITEESAYAPLGLIMWSEIEDYIRQDLSSSIDGYLLFLEKYPDSIYYDDIRMRLREIAS